MERIPVAGPWITAREIGYVADAAANGWYDQATCYHERFERATAEYLEVRHAVALPSCTSAIHLALAALGVGPGDEVLVPDVTWIATAAPIQYVGAEPVFVDMDETTWCLSVQAMEAAITPRTRAILAVDLYGHMPDYEMLQRIATRHGLPVIEDAAEAFGSELRGRKAGSFGDAAVFSFHGSKTLTTGEGGMLVTNRDDLLERVLFLRDHGRQPGDRSFRSQQVAFKYRMSGVQAALGLGQVERADELTRRKREIFSWYCDELADDIRLQLNPDQAAVRNSYWMTTAIVEPRLQLSKETLVRRLALRGIDSRPFFYPLSSLPAYADTAAARLAQTSNHVARRITPFGVNLPSALCLTRRDVATVASTLREILDESCDASPQPAELERIARRSTIPLTCR